MNTKFLLAAFVSANICLSAWAGFPGTYQATGLVLDLRDTRTGVQKDNEKWELARTADTKVTGELKAGSKFDDGKVRRGEITSVELGMRGMAA